MDKPKSDSEIVDKIKNLVWATMSFNLPSHEALKFLNSGYLGFQKDKSGKDKLNAQKEKIPIVMSERTYFRYKEKFSELPEHFQYLKQFALKGYVQKLIGFQEEIEVLHRLSTQNMLVTKDPMDRQKIIDSLLTTVIPTQSAFTDILKETVDEMKSTGQMDEK